MPQKNHLSPSRSSKKSLEPLLITPKNHLSLTSCPQKVFEPHPPKKSLEPHPLPPKIAWCIEENLPHHSSQKTRHQKWGFSPSSCKGTSLAVPQSSAQSRGTWQGHPKPQGWSRGGLGAHWEHTRQQPSCCSHLLFSVEEICLPIPEDN